MGGIADEHDAALVPVADRTAVAALPATTDVHHGEQLAHGRVRVTIRVLQLGTMRLDITLVAVGRGAEYRHDVEQRAVTQRIVHDVESGPAPQHHLLTM